VSSEKSDKYPAWYLAWVVWLSPMRRRTVTKTKLSPSEKQARVKQPTRAKRSGSVAAAARKVNAQQRVDFTRKIRRGP